MNNKTPGDNALDKLQRDTFDYFLKETSRLNGLATEKTAPDRPSSIAATGIALACYSVSVERGYMSLGAAVERMHETLQFFRNSPHDPSLTLLTTRDFIIVFSTCRPAGVSGNASYQLWIALFTSWRFHSGHLSRCQYFNGR